MYRSLIGPSNLQCLFWIACFQDGVSGGFQESYRHISQLVVVFQYQNRLRSMALAGRSRDLHLCDRRCFAARKVDFERRTLPRFTVDPYESRALLYNPIDSGETKSSPLAQFFGGKERLENAGPGFLVHPDA